MNAWNNKFATLVRREFWEHKALWMAPVIVGAVIVIVPLLGGTAHFGEEGASLSAGPGVSATVSPMPGIFGKATMMGVAVTLGGVTCLALFSYLLDCLYAERKDRSILFWKSLPVSDAQTVLAKLAVALVLVPLLALLVAALVQPLLTAVLYLRYDNLRVVVSPQSVLDGYKALPHVAVVWLYGALWYSPFVAWMLLASVAAKRVPLMYALMPPVVLMLVEAFMFDTHRVAMFLGSRLAPWAREDWAWTDDKQRGLLPGLGSPDWSTVFLNSSLWLGVAAAALMVYLVIRLRRYRDDT